MIGIHPVHRRLAELHEKAERLGDYSKLAKEEQLEFLHCIEVNAKLVRQIDELKQLAYVAQLGGDMSWVQEICKQIDELEVKLI